VAQYRVETGSYDPKISNHFEVVMLANNANGDIVTVDNPLPVRSIINSVESSPFQWQLARGQVTGATSVNIFGYNSSIGTSPQTVWDVSSDYTFPPSASILTIKSTSSLDNANARILITGLDSNWNLLNESLALNGTSNVSTTNSFLRINQMIMVHNGASQNTNVGTITAKRNGDNNTYAQINPGIGKTQMALYSVAAGKTFYLTKITALSGDASGSSKYMNFRAVIHNGITDVEFVLLQTTWQNIYQVERVIPLAYGEKQDIKWQLFASSTTASGSVIVEGALLTN
jgi:hypothetical protein